MLSVRSTAPSSLAEVASHKLVEDGDPVGVLQIAWTAEFDAEPGRSDVEVRSLDEQ